eukprot:8294751-Pyramimonas_sp.AAC.1
MAGAAKPMRRASDLRRAASTAPTASLCRASEGGSCPLPWHPKHAKDYAGRKCDEPAASATVRVT